MGLRLDLNIANWVAYLLQSDMKVPRLASDINEYEALDAVLRKLNFGFRSSPRREQEFEEKISRARSRLDKYGRDSRGMAEHVLTELRADLVDRAWTALIIPSWINKEVDRFLCSDKLLRELVNPEPKDDDQTNSFSGLILQLEEPEHSEFPLLDVFPAFEEAMRNSYRWPGILVWTNREDLFFADRNEGSKPKRSRFFPIPISAAIGNPEKTTWYIKKKLIKQLESWVLGFPPSWEEQESPSSHRVINILQVSDIHLGTKEANKRLPQLQGWIRQLCAQLNESGPVIPIVTGDLMNTNNEHCVNQAHLFIDFLSHLGTERPRILLGNHDVRGDGIFREDFTAAIHIYADPPDVHWYDDHKLGLVCFNSVLGGDLARGEITDQQRVFLNNRLAQKGDYSDYLLVAALHHHPVKVDLPEWYVRPFYEKICGAFFEVTDELTDAQSFVKFVENHDMALVLHGHKHIPKISKTPLKQIPVFGCGSSVGKVKRKNRQVYLSLNVLTIDTRQRCVTGRLLAQPLGGGTDHEEDRDTWYVDLIRRFRGGPHQHQLIYRREVP